MKHYSSHIFLSILLLLFGTTESMQKEDLVHNSSYKKITYFTLLPPHLEHWCITQITKFDGAHTDVRNILLRTEHFQKLVDEDNKNLTTFIYFFLKDSLNLGRLQSDFVPRAVQKDAADALCSLLSIKKGYKAEISHLRRAVSCNAAKCLAVLLDKFPELDINSLDTYCPNTLLAAAIIQKSMDCLSVLLQDSRIDVNKFMMIGMQDTPLHIAIFQESEECIQALLSHPKINVNLCDRYLQTSLFYAITANNNIKIIELLLAQPNILINAADDCGFTALHIAASEGRVVKVERLLAMPGIDVFARDNKNRTAYDRTANPEIRELLFQAMKAKK